VTGRRTRSEAQRERRLRSFAARGESGHFFSARAVKRLAAMNADSKPEPRQYTLEGIAVALRCSIGKVLRLVRTRRLPKPDRMLGVNPRWNASTIEPLLQRCGYSLPAIERDREPGSRLDADHPENGVLIPCRITL
jgi:hypothetical protein